MNVGRGFSGGGEEDTEVILECTLYVYEIFINKLIIKAKKEKPNISVSKYACFIYLYKTYIYDFQRNTVIQKDNTVS